MSLDTELEARLVPLEEKIAHLNSELSAMEASCSMNTINLENKFAGLEPITGIIGDAEKSICDQFGNTRLSITKECCTLFDKNGVPILYINDQGLVMSEEYKHHILSATREVANSMEAASKLLDV